LTASAESALSSGVPSRRVCRERSFLRRPVEAGVQRHHVLGPQHQRRGQASVLGVDQRRGGELGGGDGGRVDLGFAQSSHPPALHRGDPQGADGPTPVGGRGAPYADAHHHRQHRRPGHRPTPRGAPGGPRPVGAGVAHDLDHRADHQGQPRPPEPHEAHEQEWSPEPGCPDQRARRLTQGDAAHGKSPERPRRPQGFGEHHGAGQRGAAPPTTTRHRGARQRGCQGLQDHEHDAPVGVERRHPPQSRDEHPQPRGPAGEEPGSQTQAFEAPPHEGGGGEGKHPEPPRG